MFPHWSMPALAGRAVIEQREIAINARKLPVRIFEAPCTGGGKRGPPCKAVTTAGTAAPGSAFPSQMRCAGGARRCPGRGCERLLTYTWRTLDDSGAQKRSTDA